MTSEWDGVRRRSADRTLRARIWRFVDSKAGTFVLGLSLASLGWVGGTVLSWRDTMQRLKDVDPVVFAAHVKTDEQHHADTDAGMERIARILEHIEQANAKRDTIVATHTQALLDLTRAVDRIQTREMAAR